MKHWERAVGNCWIQGKRHPLLSPHPEMQSFCQRREPGQPGTIHPR